MDINQLLNPDIDEEEVGNHILANTLMELGKNEEQARLQANRDRVSNINTSQQKGNYNNTDLSGNTITSRGSIKASVDENGNVSVTNIGTTPNAQIGGLTGINPEERLGVNNIDARIKALSSSGSTVEAALGFGQLKSDFDTMKIGVLETARKNAFTSQRVPELEANLARLQRLDDEVTARNPNASVGASPATIQAMQLLTTAKNNAEQMALQSAGSNISLVAMGNKLAAAEPAIKSSMARQEASDIRMDAKKELKLEQVDSFIKGVPTETLARIKQANPKFDDEAVASFIMTKQVQAPDEFKAFTAKPEQLAPLAFAENNLTAEKFLVDEEVIRTGKDIRFVQAEVAQVKEYMNDTKLIRKKAIKLYGGEDSEGYKSISEALGKELLTKEGKAEGKNIRYQMALRIVAAEKQQGFKDDVSQWRVSGLDEAIAKNKTLSLPPTMTNILNQYVGETVGADRITKVQTFTKLMREAGRKEENSAIAGINTDLLVQDIALNYVNTGLFRQLGALNTRASADLMHGIRDTAQQLPGKKGFETFLYGEDNSKLIDSIRNSQ